MKTLQDYKTDRLECVLREWQDKLRSKLKYEENQNTTWDEVAEVYYETRNEYLVVDLLDENL